MKKFLLAAIAVLTLNVAAMAQAPIQWRSQVMTVKNAAGTVKAADTLTNTDTNTIGYRVTYPYDVVISAKYQLLTGYGRGTSKLQGTNDTTGTYDTWHTVRGDKTYCPSCMDSVYTINNASGQARWKIPKDAGFTYYRLYNMTDTTETIKITSKLDYGY